MGSHNTVIKCIDSIGHQTDNLLIDSVPDIFKLSIDDAYNRQVGMTMINPLSIKGVLCRYANTIFGYDLIEKLIIFYSKFSIEKFPNVTKNVPVVQQSFFMGTMVSWI